MKIIELKAENVKATNRKVRDKARRAALAKEAATSKSESDKLTAEIEKVDEDKADALAKAPFPVEGLAFDESGVLYNDIPFSQASAAEQLRVSVAIGLAMNPKLRVLLIRDGSLLDADSMNILTEIAEKRDAQIWIERVSDGDSVGVVIEDGSVAGAETVAAE